MPMNIPLTVFPVTLTSTGVEKSINYWMGPQGYGQFLQRLASDRNNLNLNIAVRNNAFYFCLPIMNNITVGRGIYSSVTAPALPLIP